jgi:HPt (histidine-containing phosphotransfer) domain-containing protein
MQTCRIWDPERIREVVGDDREILLELVALFFDDTQQRLRTLDVSVASGELATTRNEVHAIKGAAGNFGAERLFEVAKKMEEAARGGDPAATRALYSELRACFAELRTVLQRANLGI